MQIDKKIRRRLVDNLEQWLISVQREVRNSINDIEDSDTVEELMEHKSDLLRQYVHQIPMDVGLCYFCLKHKSNFGTYRDCSECEYGAIHGLCTDDDSDFDTIDQAMTVLEDAILIKYYDDDEYQPVKPKKKKKGVKK